MHNASPAMLVSGTAPMCLTRIAMDETPTRSSACTAQYLRLSKCAAELTQLSVDDHLTLTRFLADLVSTV